jgi:hypothetical protein
MVRTYHSFWLMYEDPTPEEKAAAEKAAADAAAAAAAAGKTFKQDEVNALLAKERRTLQDKNKQLVQQLEAMQQQSNLTVQQKEDLQKQIDDLNSQYQTKEQQLQDETKKLQKKLEADTKVLSSERDHWRNTYESEARARAISDAATAEEAFNPTQIVAFLEPKTRIVEDKSGTTIKYVPKVKFASTNDKGESIELDLTVPEAVKKMKEDTARYGNLFKSTLNGGVGGKANDGGAGNADISKMSFDEYQKYRASQGFDKMQTT